MNYLLTSLFILTTIMAMALAMAMHEDDQVQVKAFSGSIKWTLKDFKHHFLTDELKFKSAERIDTNSQIIVVDKFSWHLNVKKVGKEIYLYLVAVPAAEDQTALSSNPSVWKEVDLHLIIGEVRFDHIMEMYLRKKGSIKRLESEIYGIVEQEFSTKNFLQTDGSLKFEMHFTVKSTKYMEGNTVKLISALSTGSITWTIEKAQNEEEINALSPDGPTVANLTWSLIAQQDEGDKLNLYLRAYPCEKSTDRIDSAEVEFHLTVDGHPMIKKNVVEMRHYGNFDTALEQQLDQIPDKDLLQNGKLNVQVDFIVKSIKFENLSEIHYQNTGH